jgi:hypothetical protein
MSMENHGEVILTVENYSTTRALRQSYQQSFISKPGGTGEGNYEFVLMKYLC